MCQKQKKEEDVEDKATEKGEIRSQEGEDRQIIEEKKKKKKKKKNI